MSDEANGETLWFKCPFGCPCLFLCLKDLERHLNKSRITGYKPNNYDHKIWWEKQLRDRDREFLGGGGYE